MIYLEILKDEVQLRVAFEKACADLGVAPFDLARRENLALIVLSIAHEGESDADVIQHTAVDIMRRGHF
jgi:hypothetical protein